MTRTILFSDEPAAAAGLKELLSHETEIRLEGSWDNLKALGAGLKTAQADLLVLDVTPDVTVRTIYELRECAPECRIVLWVRTISRELAFQAMEQGVCGILRKNDSVETLLKCLRVVGQGGLWLEDDLARGLTETAAVKLSPREGQLVSLLATGMKNKEIAASLGLSEGTVKTYLAKLFKKVGVRDRFDLALHGLRNLAETDAKLQPDLPPVAEGKDPVPPQAGCLRSIVLSRPSTLDVSNAYSRSAAA